MTTHLHGVTTSAWSFTRNIASMCTWDAHVDTAHAAYTARMTIAPSGLIIHANIPTTTGTGAFTGLLVTVAGLPAHLAPPVGIACGSGVYGRTTVQEALVSVFAGASGLQFTAYGAQRSHSMRLHAHIPYPILSKPDPATLPGLPV